VPESAESQEGTTRKSGNPAGVAVFWILLVVAVAASAWWGIRALRETPVAGEGAQAGGGPSGPPPATVLTSIVVEESIREQRRVTGSLRARKRSNVTAREAGAAEEVHVDVGMSVAAGDPIVSLDARKLRAEGRELEARVTSAAAVVEQRKAEEERARTDFERKGRLFEQRAVSETEYLDAGEAASVAEARLREAEDAYVAIQSTLELARVRLDDMVVKAPFDGRIVTRDVDPGEWLAPGETVVTMISTGEIEAWLNVPERFFSGVEAGNGAWTIVADGSGVSGDVKSYRRVSDIDPVTRLFPVVAVLDDREGLLAPGQSVYAELPVASEETLLRIPVDAVGTSFAGTVIFRVQDQGEGELPIAEKIPVAVRFRRGGFAYVEPGALQPGDRIVVEGNERLFPGTPLMAEDASAVRTAPPIEVAPQP